MHLFDAEDVLQKYTTISSIIDSYYTYRLKLYLDRKDYMIDALKNELLLLSNKTKYIKENLDGTIDLRRKTATQVSELLSGLKLVMIDGDYKYLIKMAMDSVTTENVATIMKEKADTEMQLETLKKTSLEKMWLGELSELEIHYDLYKTKREKLQAGGGEKKTVKKLAIKK